MPPMDVTVRGPKGRGIRKKLADAARLRRRTHGARRVGPSLDRLVKQEG